MDSSQRKMDLSYLSGDTCKAVFANVFDNSFQKFIFTFGYCSFTYLYHDGKELLAVFALLIIDLITGVMKARKQKVWRGSTGFRRTAEKFFVYLLMIGTASVVDKQFTDVYITLTKVFGFQVSTKSALMVMNLFLVSTEAISILENISALGWPVPLKLLQFLKMHSTTVEEKKK